ncbi:MAG: AAA family ATPase [candidate division KSB1 bacterium]|nr:AAA family ATPase [candidate division KSB1 bacterium]
MKNSRSAKILFPDREQFPFNLSIFDDTRDIEFNRPVTCFVGENGSGKSTVLEALARRCGIHIWENRTWARADFEPYEDKFHHFIHVEWVDEKVQGSFFGSDTFRDYARIVEEWAAADPGQLNYVGGKSLLSQSHGQSIMSFFRARYEVKGLYLLDEPETALSPRTLLKLRQLMTEMSRAGHAQFVLATHSPILMSIPDSELYSFDQNPVRQIGFKDTDHYQIYKKFLNECEQD